MCLQHFIKVEERFIQNLYPKYFKCYFNIFSYVLHKFNILWSHTCTSRTWYINVMSRTAHIHHTCKCHLHKVSANTHVLEDTAAHFHKVFPNILYRHSPIKLGEKNSFTCIIYFSFSWYGICLKILLLLLIHKISYRNKNLWFYFSCSKCQ